MNCDGTTGLAAAPSVVSTSPKGCRSASRPRASNTYRNAIRLTGLLPRFVASIETKKFLGGRCYINRSAAEAFPSRKLGNFFPGLQRPSAGPPNRRKPAPGAGLRRSIPLPGCPGRGGREGPQARESRSSGPGHPGPGWGPSPALELRMTPDARREGTGWAESLWGSSRTDRKNAKRAAVAPGRPIPDYGHADDAVCVDVAEHRVC